MVHNHHVVGTVDFFLDRFSKVRVEEYIYIDTLICVIFNVADMVAKKLIAFFAFVMLITLLEQQIKSGVHGRMAKPKKAGRVKVIYTGPRVRKLKKNVKLE